MDFALTETQEITRKTVRDFAEQEIIPQSAACLTDYRDLEWIEHSRVSISRTEAYFSERKC